MQAIVLSLLPNVSPTDSRELRRLYWVGSPVFPLSFKAKGSL